MDIFDPRSLRERANHALARGRDPKKLVITYAGITIGISLFVTLITYWLENQISGTGGLGNMGMRAIFSTGQQGIPMISTLIAMGLELGYLGGMLRISRGQYADHTDLKISFRKFCALLRLMFIECLLYLAVGILAIQIASIIFSMSPMAEPAAALIQTLDLESIASMDEATYLALIQALIPMYIISGILFFIGLIPVLFRLRMTKFCLLDDPQNRALAAVRASSRMMRRRFIPMLKIDLSLWMYYGATFLMMLLMYADLILALLGVQVPLDPTLFSFLVYGAALAVQFVTLVLLRNRAETMYLLIYDQLREKPENSGPVVLGNIFDM